MLDSLRSHYRDPRSQEALNCLDDATKIGGWETIDPDKLALQIFYFPSHDGEYQASWSLFQSEDNYILRRVRWDFNRDQEVPHGHASVFGFDTRLPRCDVDQRLSALQDIEFRAFAKPHSYSISGGESCGVRMYIADHHKAEIWWSRGNLDWGHLDEWHETMVTFLESHLPK